MRIDKYLKVSRIIKRRTVAKEACDSGRVSINGKVAKAGDEIKIGDILEIEFGKGILKYRITNIIENPRKDDSSSMYEVVG